MSYREFIDNTKRPLFSALKTNLDTTRKVQDKLIIIDLEYSSISDEKKSFFRGIL